MQRLSLNLAVPLESHLVASFMASIVSYPSTVEVPGYAIPFLHHDPSSLKTHLIINNPPPPPRASCELCGCLLLLLRSGDGGKKLGTRPEPTTTNGGRRRRRRKISAAVIKTEVSPCCHECSYFLSFLIRFHGKRKEKIMYSGNNDFIIDERISFSARRVSLFLYYKARGGAARGTISNGNKMKQL